MKALCVPQTRALYKPPGSWRFCTVSKLFLGLCSSGQRPFDVVPVDYHYIWLVASSWNSKAATQDLFSLVVSPIGTWGHLVYIVHRCPCTLSQLGYTASTCILHPAIMLDSLHDTFVRSATWVLLSMVDSCLYGSDGICQRYRPSWGLVVHDGSSSCSNHCLSSAASDLNSGWGWGTYLHPAL